MNLTRFQREIVNDCLKKQSGGLVLPMGSGKTLISLATALLNTRKTHSKRILIVCSKSLIFSWRDEINKFFPELNVKTLQCVDDTYESSEEITIVITTLDGMTNLQIWKTPGSKPILKNDSGLYGTTYSSLIIDEGHKYMNTKTIICKALTCIASNYRWILSGTLFSEPALERVLGFICILHIPGPRCMNDISRFINPGEFKGIQQYCVLRENSEELRNESGRKLKINKKVITYNLENIEKRIFDAIKLAIEEIKIKLEESQGLNNRFIGSLLGLISHLRIALVSPDIIVADTAIKYYNNDDSLATKTIMKYYEKLNIIQSFNEKFISFRFQKTLKILEEYKNEQVVIFSSFRKPLTLLKEYIQSRNVYTIASSYSVESRNSVINNFKRDPAGVLLLTYEIGAEGLNLQTSSIGVLLDITWNSSISRQAVARMYRRGQQKDVNIYMFCSDTNIEHTLFKKHFNKENIADFLLTGNTCTIEEDSRFNMKKILDSVSLGVIDLKNIEKTIST
jgi:SNF2 family DNA or RNA helicase